MKSVCAVLLLTLALLARASALPADLYVAPDGSDQAPGSKTQPFQTVEAARDAIRQAKQSGALPRTGVTVWIAPGEYWRTNTFELTAADSGAPGAPIVYRAADGKPARFIGGRPVVGFQPVTDPAISERLDPAARDAVVQADLRAQGITDFGKLKSRGFTRPDQTTAALEVFYDGQPMTLARWPNGSFAKIAGFPPATATKTEDGQAMGGLEGGFYYEGDRPNRWKSLTDVWVHGYWAQDWADTYEQVASIDLAAHWVKTLPPYGKIGFRKGQRFYFLNVLEELDQPGEWYLDRGTGRLYFWPPGPLAHHELLVSILEKPLLILTNAASVTVRGLTFECTRGQAVEINGGTSNRVSDCTIRNIGSNGIIVHDGTHQTIRGCQIEQTGDSGIRLGGGVRLTLTPGDNSAVDNYIHDFGRWCRCYRPAVMVGGVGNRVAHNQIHDGPHNAIQLSGNDHVIEYNEIYRVCTQTGDVGAFYMGRDWTQRGNVVRYNYFHDLGGMGFGSMAVYLDDMTSGTTVLGNIFYRTQRAVFIGGGRDNTVENNIFVDCQTAVHVDARGVSPLPMWHNMVYGAMRKRLDEMKPAEALYQQRYPRLAEVEQSYASSNGVPPGGNVIIHNLQFGGKWSDLPKQPGLLKLITVRDNLTGVDPLFVDREKGDFRLQPDSPAFQLGFKAIPIDKIGPEKTP